MSKSEAPRSKTKRTNISELCAVNKFLINQNVRVLLKYETAKARLIVACAFCIGQGAALITILINGGFD